jgi:aspartyl-tRNA synthetase
MNRTHYTNQIDTGLLGQRTTIAGWIEDIRDIGKVIFLTVRDVKGLAQAVVSGQGLDLIRDKPRQSAVIVSGLVQNSKSNDFLLEIKADKIYLVNNAIPPFPIDPTGRVQSALDKRMDSRALDLRSPKTASIFILRSIILENIRNTLRSSGFIEVNTPKIIGSASEGGANLFEFEYFKKRAYLAQSPQVYKEQLVLALDRVFEIASYFRAEKSHTLRHLSEFLSVDIEAAFTNMDEIINLAELVLMNIFSMGSSSQTQRKGLKPSVSLIPKPFFPLKRLTYERCVEELKKQGEKLEFGDDLSDASLRALGQLHKGFYFILEWPTKLKPFYIKEKDDNPSLSHSFDLQFGHLELISGGQRQHDPIRLRERMIEQNLNPENFEHHLRAFNWGMPPHSGWGLGFDRLIMALTNIDNIREAVLYPRDTDRLTP